LIRASINLRQKFFRRRWITGSSPVMTISIGIKALCGVDITLMVATISTISTLLFFHHLLHRPPLGHALAMCHHFRQGRQIDAVISAFRGCPRPRSYAMTMPAIEGVS
jgi:hypothetical protein